MPLPIYAVPSDPVVAVPVSVGAAVGDRHDDGWWRPPPDVRRMLDQVDSRSLQRFGERTVVELTALIGYYTMVAMTLNCHEIPLPEGVQPAFPLPQHEALR